MAIFQKTFCCICAFMGCICLGFGQANLSNASFADPYSYKTFNRHQYIVYRAYDDTVRNNYAIGDLRSNKRLIDVYFNWIFDYHLTADSILSVIGYQGKPKSSRPNEDTVDLAFFRYDLRTAQRLDSQPLLNLHYYKFDQDGYIGVRQKDGGGFVNRYLKYDATEAERGLNVLYPHRDSNYYLTRDAGSGNFRIVWSSVRTMQVQKVKVQPDGPLLVQNSAGQFQFISSDGLTTTGLYAKAFNFSEYKSALTAAARADHDWDLVKSPALQTEKINMRPGGTIESIKQLRGSSSLLFLKIKMQGDEYWSLHKAGNDSIDQDFAIRYSDILPLLQKNGKHYLLAEKDSKVKLIEYQKNKSAVEIWNFDASTLQKAELLWAEDSSLTCRFAIRDKTGKAFNIVDLKVDKNNAKSSGIVLLETVASYFKMDNLLALETMKGEWYVRNSSIKVAPKDELPSRDDFIKLNIHSLQPFTTIILKGKQKRKLALAEQAGKYKTRTTVYFDLEDMRNGQWQPMSWKEWYNNHK